MMSYMPARQGDTSAPSASTSSEEVASAQSRPLLRQSSDPLWMQLMRVLRDDIEAGRLAPDAALPSEAALGAAFAVSRTVVREALRELGSQGLVYSIKGKGTFVAPRTGMVSFVGSIAGSADDLRHSGRRVVTRILEQEVAEADAHESAALEQATGSLVVRLTRLRLVDGVPWMLTRACLPSELVPGLERMSLENKSLYDVLRREYGIEAAAADRWLQAISAPQRDARQLGVDPGAPVLRIESVSWQRDGRRFETYSALHRSDQIRFYVGIR